MSRKKLEESIWHIEHDEERHPIDKKKEYEDFIALKKQHGLMLKDQDAKIVHDLYESAKMKEDERANKAQVNLYSLACRQRTQKYYLEPNC